MAFVIMRASTILFLSLSVQKINAIIEVVDYATAEFEGAFSSTATGLEIKPNQFQAVCGIGGMHSEGAAVPPRANPGFGKYKVKLVEAEQEASFNLLPCKTSRGILFMRRIAEGCEDRCFIMYIHNPPLGKGTYLRKARSGQSST